MLVGDNQVVEALSSGKGLININVAASVKGEEFASALIDGRYLDGTKFTTINDNFCCFWCLFNINICNIL